MFENQKFTSAEAENYHALENGASAELDPEVTDRFERLDPVQQARTRSRAEELRNRLPRLESEPTESQLYEASIEIEEKLTIPDTDEGMRQEQITLIQEYPQEYHSSGPKTEEITQLIEKIRNQIEGLQNQRYVNLLNSNPEIFYGIPEEIVNAIKYNSIANTSGKEGAMEDLGHLLSLPYHLQKMRHDGVTHIVASAVSSIPYCNVLKRIDEILYPDQDKIKFSIYSTKLEGESRQARDQKLVEYFGSFPEAKIGVFDECASSDPHSQFNKRPTVTQIKNEMEELLQTTVVGRYGTDTMYPQIEIGKQPLISTNSSGGHGDEGKGTPLFWMSDLIEDDKFEVKKAINLFKSDGDNRKIKYNSRGYGRSPYNRFNEDAQRTIEKLERLAEIACTNFAHNPDSLWNPLNYKIKIATCHRYSQDEWPEGKMS